MGTFDGFDFDDLYSRKRMKYLIITSCSDGLNRSYGFKNKRDLIHYLKHDLYYDLYAVFKVADITANFPPKKGNDAK